MITNKGKEVISKYMVGQTPAYASYIAIGCGATPVVPGTTLTGLQTKEVLDFEVARVPVTSRGYVTEIVDGNPVQKLVLTAQIPSESRYGITEIGLYPAVANPVAINNDSKMLLNFDSSESWSKSLSGTTSLVAEGFLGTVSETITATEPILTNAIDTVLVGETRKGRNEIPRNGYYSIVVPGQMTTFTGSTPSGNYLVLPNLGINLSNSSPSDVLKIAFSILPTTIPATISGSAKIVVEFSSSPNIATADYARAEFNVADISTNSRYFVDSINVGDLQINGSFSWSTASYVKVFVKTSSSGMFVALDGLRLDNVSSVSPVYGLVGYTIIKNSMTTSGGTTSAVPVVKDKDGTSFIEFRFQVGVA